MVYSTRRFVLCLTLCHFVLVFFSPFSIAVTLLGEERELILVLFARLFDLCLFGFIGFLFLFVSGTGCGLWLWHSLDFSLTFLFTIHYREIWGDTTLTQAVANPNMDMNVWNSCGNA